MIKIRGLEKSFATEKVLQSIDLDIEKGDIFGLVGKSGVGKSTLLRCINGLEKYDAGSLIVNGQEVNSLKGKELREFRRGVGMIFQYFSLIERDTVYENIALPMRCWKCSKKEIDNKVEMLLDVVGLKEKRNQKARNLSGGQKQRVAIARALALNSSILLCDEATSSLDPSTTKSILTLLNEINRKMNVTIIIVTHEMSVIRAVCNKVAVLDKSGIADVGDVESVFMNQCPALVDLLGEEKEIELEETGKYIKFFYSSNSMEKNIISQMAQQTGVTFDLTGASMNKYSTGVFGDFIIHFKNEDEDKIISFLEKNQIKWEELN